MIISSLQKGFGDKVASFYTSFSCPHILQHDATNCRPHILQREATKCCPHILQCEATKCRPHILQHEATKCGWQIY